MANQHWYCAERENLRGMMLESELFQLLEGTTDAAFIVTEQGEICSWNKAAEKLFGYAASEVLHKTCHEVLEGRGTLGTPVCHENCSVLECVGKKEEVPNFDLNTRTRSGERLWVNMSTVKFQNPRTGRRLLIHLAHDISEQKKTEELVHRMQELSQQLSDLGTTVGRAAPVSPLSEQEKHILRLFSEGKDSPEVAAELDISLQTLRNHLHHINQKLRTRTRLEAVMHAIQRKLI
jgi:PAS domain S-box-containing protein